MTDGSKILKISGKSADLDHDVTHMANRQWAGAETIVLAGGSHGGFLAQYYAIQHGDKLRGLILRDTFTNGVSGAMTILAAILTFNRNVDIARQVRNWSGTLYNDQDYEEAIREMGSIHDPPDHPPRTQSIEEKPKSRGIPKSNIHSATHNAAFSANMLALDVRPRLKEIKVKKGEPLHPRCLTCPRFPPSLSLDAMM